MQYIICHLKNSRLENLHNYLEKKKVGFSFPVPHYEFSFLWKLREDRTVDSKKSSVPIYTLKNIGLSVPTDLHCASVKEERR